VKKTPAWISSREAAKQLDVKLSTLYAYTSRGLVESVKGPNGRGRLYARESIERLKTRHDARAGHTAVAASALRWGEPTLETSIVEIRSDGPYCHGHSLLALAAGSYSFEAVCDLLWTGQLQPSADWKVVLPGVTPPARPASAAPLAYMAAALSLAALSDDSRKGGSDAQEHARARNLIAWLAELAGGRKERPSTSPHDSVATRLLRGFGKRPTAHLTKIVDRALTLCADHELTASTFAARVTASTGSDLYACLAAGLHALDGPHHGGVSSRIQAVLREMGRPERALVVVRERLARGERVPGFGHPLYPDGDPRAVALLALSAESKLETPQLARLLALTAAMKREGHPPPNFDIGLVALVSALSLPEGAPAALFAVGRCAGYVAHILEQRKQGYLLRPRARFVAPGTSV
jgi:citrate synthase